MAPKCYQIVVAGELSCRFAPAFDGMTVQCGAGQTEITGMVVDQSHLHGLLDRVAELGLDLVSVNAIVEEGHPSARSVAEATPPAPSPPRKGVR